MNNVFGDDLRQTWVSVRNGLIVALVPALVWIFWAATESGGPHDAIALDHALAARNVVTGHGMTSPVLTPLHLSLHGDGRAAGPIFAEPLFVLWEALIFKAGKISDGAAIVASGIPWMVTAWLVFLLAHRLHSPGAAWLCFFIFLFNTVCLDLSVSGRPETMGMMLVCLLFLLLTFSRREREADRPPYACCLFTGLLAGCLSMVVPYAAGGLMLFLVIYWYLWPRRSHLEPALDLHEYEVSLFRIAGAWLQQRLCVRTTLMTLGGAIAPIITVFLIRVLMPGPLPASLKRYLMMVDTSAMPGWSVWRADHLLEPSWLTMISGNLIALLNKFMLSTADGFGGMLNIVHPVLFALFVFALIHPECGEKHGLRWKLLALAPLHILIMAWFYVDEKYLSIWIAPALVIGAGSFIAYFEQRLLKGEPSRRYKTPVKRLQLEIYAYHLPIALAVAFTVSPFFLRVAGGPPPPRLRASENLSYLITNQDRYTMIVTPAPWMVSWFTGSESLWLPETASGMEKIEQQYGDRIRAVFLPRLRAGIKHDRVPPWWFFALQQPDTFPEYVRGEAIVWGEGLYVKEDQ